MVLSRALPVGCFAWLVTSSVWVDRARNIRDGRNTADAHLAIPHLIVHSDTLAAEMEYSHAFSVEEVAAKLETNVESGLTVDEARRRLDVYGRNELPADESTPLLKLILEQFDDTLVKILLLAAVISFVLAIFETNEEEKTTAFIEPIVILLILIANAFVGVWQESNAEKAIDELKRFEAPEAKVFRGSSLPVTIPASELVPGDIVLVEVGDKVPADIRMIRMLSTTVKADQSLLTGESQTVFKYPDVVPDKLVENQGKKNILFSGTTLDYGKCRGIVVSTGQKSAIGQIHKDMTETDAGKTPLQAKLDEFGETLSKFILAICVLVWMVNIGHFADPSHGGWVRGAVYYFKIAVALAVAAIPEGLPAVVTTCLALGTRKMARKNAIVRVLPSVETLGCTTVICSDKTGTLTTNKMNVVRVVSVSSSSTRTLNEYEVTGNGYSPIGQLQEANGMKRPFGRTNPGAQVDPALAEMSRIFSLCNDSTVVYTNGGFDRIGEPTEAALRVLAEKIGVPDADSWNRISGSNGSERAMAVSSYWNDLWERQATLEFSRDRKSMSVLVTYREADSKSAGGRYATRSQSRPRSNNAHLLVKGAPESILERSTSVLQSDGTVTKLTDEIRLQLSNEIHNLSTGQHTLRCLAAAYREVTEDRASLDLTSTEKFIQYEQNLTFVGVAGMLDPPREEVRESLRVCREAGIRVIVITGDNKDTAEAICRRIGLFEANEDVTGKSFTGREFDDLKRHGENAQGEAVQNACLFSRTEPSHKLDLVRHLQNRGEVVAMTGDGVNDAPALKRADIGVAMGSGTEVAKSASDMVLADDNFASIVAAVQEGRAIYMNTKQFIRYLISSNIGEVVCIFLTAALGMPEALIPVQLLWVNLVTDGLPATALGFNPPDDRIMKSRPRNMHDSIINGWAFFRYLVIGTYVGIATVGGFAWWFMYYHDGPQLSFYDLTHFHRCVEGQMDYSCKIFTDRRPMTVALSVLVLIEMFNALNAISESQSIITFPPHKNLWLIGAIAVSLSLHMVILYIPFFNSVFQVAPISFDEWTAVFWWSLPVIFLDELMKLFSRVFVESKSNVIRSEKKNR